MVKKIKGFLFSILFLFCLSFVSANISTCQHVEQEGRYYCTLYENQTLIFQDIFGNSLKNNYNFNSINIEYFNNQIPDVVKLRIKDNSNNSIVTSFLNEGSQYNHSNKIFFYVQSINQYLSGTSYTTYTNGSPVSSQIPNVVFAIETEDSLNLMQVYLKNQSKDKTYFDGHDSYCIEGDSVNEASCVLYEGDLFYFSDYAKRNAPFLIKTNAFISSDESIREKIILGIKIPSVSNSYSEYGMYSGENISFDLFNKVVSFELAVNEINIEDSEEKYIGFDISYIQNNTGSCIFGCSYGGNCYPIGARKSGQYCSGTSQGFINFLGANSFCEKDYECSSNVCIEGPSICKKGNFFTWISNLFS